MGHLKTRVIFKRNISNFDELRNNLLDIRCKFPPELCEKIISEFDYKIKICKEEEGIILNKTILNKYSNKKDKDKIQYDWDTLKKEKIFRIVYITKLLI